MGSVGVPVGGAVVVVVVGGAVVEVVVGALVTAGAEVVTGAGAAWPPPEPHAAPTTPSATRAATSGARRALGTERGDGITLSVAEASAGPPWGERPAFGPRSGAAYGVGVADESTTTTVVVDGTGTSTTLVGPNGTAPGMGFIQQQEKPLDDSTTGRGTGLPLALAALVILVVFTTILVKAWRNRGPRSA